MRLSTYVRRLVFAQLGEAVATRSETCIVTDRKSVV